MVILILKIYVWFVILLTSVYIIRQFVFSINRLLGNQKMYYQDIFDSELPPISVFVPMHNEELVAKNILESLINADYPKDKIEIIPINDHSTDGTQKILDEYAKKYTIIKPIERNEGRRGKPAAMNEVLLKTKNDIIIVFDADYMPPKGILRDIAVSFTDPEVGSVMGRVIPENSATNLLTRLLDIERSGGYQVDQQARYNLGLVPQYGGTVGGFRKSYCMGPDAKQCFDPNILTEDTELTLKLFISGKKVVYANRLECYEEAPEDFEVRGRQIKRWAQGHTQVLLGFIPLFIKSKNITFLTKLDGLFLLSIYSLPPLFLGAIVALLVLFFAGEALYTLILPLFFATIAFNAFGNFSSFFQIGIATFLDGSTYRIRILPFMIINVFYNAFYLSDGFINAFANHFLGKASVWQKTERFRKS
jgi:cellulose synthase/poly-beta-1,6-N-acetylglucosamine synthase-like glycosyltransferase